MTESGAAVTQAGVFSPVENGGSVRSQREGWAAEYRDHMAGLGLQAVFCKTRELSPIPMPGTTGGDAAFGAFVMPDKSFIRPAFRPPAHAVVFDVDQKPGKTADGCQTLAAVTGLLGELPPTQRLTAHGPAQGSGRLLYRIPSGLLVDDGFFTEHGGAIEVVRTGLRFSMAPGDVHPVAGTPVVCYDPDGYAADLWPVEQWPMLPLDWQMAIAEWAETRGPVITAGERSLESVKSPREAQATVTKTLDRVRQHDSGDGGFHELINRASITVGGFVGSLYDTAEAAEEALYDAVREAWGGEPDSDDVASVTSGVAIGAASPWVIAGETLEISEPAPVTEAAEPVKTLILPAPKDPAPVARKIQALLGKRAAPLLISDDEWFQYRDQRYASLNVNQVRTLLYQLTEHAEFWTKTAKGEDTLKPWSPNRDSISKVSDALRGLTDTFAETGDWTGDAADRPDTGPVLVPLGNGIYDVARDVLLPHDPRWFLTYCLPFDHDPEAQCPTWLKVLDAQWASQPDTLRAVQEWVGYLISGRTDMQKIGAFYGPKRSGKSLISRIIQALMGPGGSTGLSLASLSQTFGLQGLIGVPLAIIGDARWTNVPYIQQSVSKLLEISGEDIVEIQRKYKGQWKGKLPTRLMILSNDMPEIPDVTGTAAARLLVFRTHLSFYGREDTTLEPTILADELAGVFNWAVAGLHRLDKQGAFTQPEGAAEELEAMANAGSPVADFLSECCDREPLEYVVLDDLYKAYAAWYRAKNDLIDWTAVRPVHQTFSGQVRSIVPQPAGRNRMVVGGRKVSVIHGLCVRPQAVPVKGAEDFDDGELI